MVIERRTIQKHRDASLQQAHRMKQEQYSGEMQKNCPWHVYMGLFFFFFFNK